MTTVATQPFVFVAYDAPVAGVDEAGRGPLAGPVVAAAVVLDDRRPIEGLRDSKQLTPVQRTLLAREIRAKAAAFALGYAAPAEIDEVNILQATLFAMERAVLRLRVVPELVRVDGNQLPKFANHRARYLLEAVIGGDDTVPAISAASILAKVCRDRLMRRLHRRYPVYGFDRHKGYATQQHLEALDLHGPCPIHRRSFAPCRKGSDITEMRSTEKGSTKKGSEPFFDSAETRSAPGTERLLDSSRRQTKSESEAESESESESDEKMGADHLKTGSDPISEAPFRKRGPLENGL